MEDQNQYIAEKLLDIIRENQEGIQIKQAFKILDSDPITNSKLIEILQKKQTITIYQFDQQQYIKYVDPYEVKHLSEAEKELEREEFAVYKAIYRAKNQGIDNKQISQDSNVASTSITKIINKLKQGGWINPFKPNQAKNAQNLYLSTQYKPSDELTGGIWYENGVINDKWIQQLTDTVQIELEKKGILSFTRIAEILRMTSEKDLQDKHIIRVVDRLVYGGIIEQVPSNSEVQYKLSRWDTIENIDFLKYPALTRMPCGMCPVFNQCKPGGQISPETCIYFDKW